MGVFSKHTLLSCGAEHHYVYVRYHVARGGEDDVIDYVVICSFSSFHLKEYTGLFTSSIERIFVA